MNFIEVNGLVKKYGELTAVNNVSFTVEEGEILGFLGPNGAGKSTTMEIMEGLRKPDAGHVTICGLNSSKDFIRVMEIVGIQLQSTSMMDLLSVEESVELFASFYLKRLPAQEVIGELDLLEKRKNKIKELSGGQKQRLAIALALVHDPKVVFLDEPTTGLDPSARRQLWEIVKKLKARGCTIVLSTHYMEEAEYLCDRVAIMSQGEIIALDTPRALINQLGSGNAIEFTSANGIIETELKGLTAVTGLKKDDQRFILFSGSIHETLVALVQYSQEKGISLDNLRTRLATLEDVYIALTGRRLAENGQ